MSFLGHTSHISSHMGPGAPSWTGLRDSAGLREKGKGRNPGGRGHDQSEQRKGDFCDITKGKFLIKSSSILETHTLTAEF